MTKKSVRKICQWKKEKLFNFFLRKMDGAATFYHLYLESAWKSSIKVVHTILFLCAFWLTLNHTLSDQVWTQEIARNWKKTGAFKKAFKSEICYGCLMEVINQLLSMQLHYNYTLIKILLVSKTYPGLPSLGLVGVQDCLKLVIQLLTI